MRYVTCKMLKFHTCFLIGLLLLVSIDVVIYLIYDDDDGTITYIRYFKSLTPKAILIVIDYAPAVGIIINISLGAFFFHHL